VTFGILHGGSDDMGDGIQFRLEAFHAFDCLSRRLDR